MSYNPETLKPVITSKSPFQSNYTSRPRKLITFPADSPVTKQSFKDECDINILMNRYLATGQIPHINERAPQYLDVSGIEFQEAMQFVADANSLFHELPSRIRLQFNNDPAAFLDFCSQEKNRPEMLEMGLLKPGTVLEELPAAAPAASAAPAAPAEPVPPVA